MGKCPCPRCLTELADCDKIGQVRDMESHVTKARSYAGEMIEWACEFIFKLGYNVASAAIEHLLSMHSWVPTLVQIILSYSLAVADIISLERVCREA